MARIQLSDGRIGYTDDVIDEYLREHAAEYSDNLFKTKLIDSAKLELQQARLSGKVPFQKWDPTKKHQYSRPITIFDTETGHNDEILSVGALKVVFNKFTKQFEYVDKYERYYYATETRSKGYRERLAVHGLEQGIIAKYRHLQKASYGKHYDAKEQVALRNFIGDSIIAGHNIEGADIPWALGNNVSQDVIDTLIVMENMRGRGGNKLNEVFQDLFGKTMESAGFGHHNAMADVFANTLILSELMKRKDVTGASLRYVLNRKGTSIAPLDNPDIYGSTGVVYGKYHQYLRDPNVYVSRRTLKMASEFKDPETGDLINGMHWDDEESEWDAYEELKGGHRVARTENADVWNNTFRSIADDVKRSTAQIAQSVRDLAGSSAVDRASARPAQVRFLSKFINPAIDMAQNQKFLDAAQALHIPSTDLANYYKTALDLYKIQNKEYDPRQWQRSQKEYDPRQWQWSQYEAMADARQARKKGLITSWQYEQVIQSSNIGDALDIAIDKTNKWVNALTALSNIPVFDPQRINKAYERGISHALGAARGIIPGDLFGIASRYGDITVQNNRYRFAPFHAADNIMNAVGPAIGAIIGQAALPIPGVGAVLGGAIGKGVAGIAKAGTQIWGNVTEAKIQRHYNQMSIGYDVIGSGLNILMLPFKTLAKTTSLLSRSFLSLSGFIKNSIMGTALGNPITTLTGIDQAGFQGLGLAENLFGLGKGSLNTSAEDFARQAQLMMYGQMDMNRVRAAAILGVFDKVYGNGDFVGTIDTLAKRELSASDMALVTQVDRNMAQVLQIMKDVGATSLAQLAKGPSNMFYRAFSTPETVRFRNDQYEYGAFTGSIGNSMKRIGSNLWNAGGRDIANKISKALDSFASWTGSFKGEGLSGIWSSIKGTIKDVWSTDIIPKLLGVVDKFADWWLTALDSLIDRITPFFDEFMNAIMNIKVSGNPISGYEIGFKGHKESGFRYLFESSTTGAGPYHAQDKKGASLESILANIDHAERVGAIIEDPDTGEKVSYDQARRMARVKNYRDYGAGFQKYTHSLISVTKGGIDRALGIAPDVLAEIAESLGSVATEVKTTIELIIKDSKGNIQAQGAYVGNENGILNTKQVQAAIVSKSYGGR